MKRDGDSPADYVARMPERQRPLVEALRATILRAHPDIPEGLRFGMLDYPGLANLAARKDHVALYVTGGAGRARTALRGRERRQGLPAVQAPGADRRDGGAGPAGGGARCAGLGRRIVTAILRSPPDYSSTASAPPWTLAARAASRKASMSPSSTPCALPFSTPVRRSLTIW